LIPDYIISFGEPLQFMPRSCRDENDAFVKSGQRTHGGFWIATAIGVVQKHDPTLKSSVCHTQKELGHFLVQGTTVRIELWLIVWGPLGFLTTLGTKKILVW